MTDAEKFLLEALNSRLRTRHTMAVATLIVVLLNLVLEVLILVRLFR